jgi:hypothetical protein
MINNTTDAIAELDVFSQANPTSPTPWAFRPGFSGRFETLCLKISELLIALKSDDSNAPALLTECAELCSAIKATHSEKHTIPEDVTIALSILKSDLATQAPHLASRSP